MTDVTVKYAKLLPRGFTDLVVRDVSGALHSRDVPQPYCVRTLTIQGRHISLSYSDLKTLIGWRDSRALVSIADDDTDAMYTAYTGYITDIDAGIISPGKGDTTDWSIQVAVNTVS
jgi:hypothetical protein